MGASDGGGGQHGLLSAASRASGSFQFLELVRAVFVKDGEHLITVAGVTFCSSLPCTVFSNPAFRGRTDWGRRVIVKKL